MEKTEELFQYHVTRFSKELEAMKMKIQNFKFNFQCLKFIM